MTTPDEIDLLAGLRNGSWLDAQVFPELVFAVPGVIAEGSSLLVGPPKIGKSWLTLGCALAVAAGGHALGCLPVPARPVLLLALEDGDRRMQERCRTLLRGRPIPAGLDYLTTTAPGQVIPTIAAWLDRHAGTSPLVILDTLGKVMPPALAGESAYQRDYRIGSALKALCSTNPGASVVVVHHDRKAGSDDFVDSVSGTHGLAGAADSVIVLHRQRHEQTGTLNVTGRDVLEAEYAVTTDGGSWSLVGGSLAASRAAAHELRASAGLGDRSTAVLELVGKHPGGIGPTAVGGALGLEPKAAGVYLSRLAEAGRIVKSGRGSYTPVESVESEGGGRRQPVSTHNTFNAPPGRRCEVCRFPLDDAVDGTTHPNCEAPQ